MPHPAPRVPPQPAPSPNGRADQNATFPIVRRAFTHPFKSTVSPPFTPPRQYSLLHSPGSITNRSHRSYRTGVATAPGGSWCGKRDGGANVLETADPRHETFETEPKTGMRHRAVSTEVQIPLERLQRRPCSSIFFVSVSKSISRSLPPITSPYPSGAKGRNTARAKHRSDPAS